ncbi:MAG: 3-deoxy-7-phosphoheptulonate synthase [Bacillota bacterium]|nr:3-deoxy-7-phosphoheptulonate synthase [Bacillota bacterium]
MNRYRVVQVGDIIFGGEAPVIIAGPCSIESAEILGQIAEGVKRAGATMLRGGAYKPRTKPSYFQGLGEAGLDILAEIKKRTQLPVVTEITEMHMIDKTCRVADMLQIGSRNMYNYPLLKEIGKTGKPVLLKRAFSATIEEWIGASEYIGHDKIVFCERGIRSFDKATRNVLDLASAILVREMTGLPIVIDPSHATGRRDLIEPMSLAAIAAGADGLMIETHIDPCSSISDADQTIDIATFTSISKKATEIRKLTQGS